MSSSMIVSDNLREHFISLNQFLANMMTTSKLDGSERERELMSRLFV
jgi:hypothetical protein